MRSRLHQVEVLISPSVPLEALFEFFPRPVVCHPSVLIPLAYVSNSKMFLVAFSIPIDGKGFVTILT